MNYTTVLGVDANHLDKLAAVWPTWVKHKPSILNNPLLVFFDRDADWYSIDGILKEHLFVRYREWPPVNDIQYGGSTDDKWTNPQRHKMLSGFVHIPAWNVETDYWLKLDLDVVAAGMDDWVDDEWFTNEPAIVAHPWGYTKPAYQMLMLDAWAEKFKSLPLTDIGPLNLAPEPGSTLVRHKRIISWCGFFNTAFTRLCSEAAITTCGPCKLPVPSQDGYLWYMATRFRQGVVRANMKRRGWEHWSSLRSVREASRRVLNAQPNPAP